MPPPDVTVVLTGRSGSAETLHALGAQRLGQLRLEVIAVRAWPGEPDETPAPDGLAVRALDAAVASPSAAVNAAAAVARGRVLVLLSAGDVPEGDDLLARHSEAHTGGVAAVVGGVRHPAGGPDPLTAGWVGTWPVGAPPPPVRHLSVGREALEQAGGLDERLADLDVSVIDLLDRMAAAGRPYAVRRDLFVSARDVPPAAQLARCAEAGRSARALAALLERRGAATRERGPRRARVSLRWMEPLLHAHGALGPQADGRPAALRRRAAFARGLGGFAPPLESTARGGLIPADAPGERPPVAVVVPFAGSGEDAAALIGALAGLDRREGDDVVVVDNSRTPTVRADRGIRVVRADAEWSSYHARNRGAAAVATPWILFLDSDCRPAPWLLDAYFSPPPAEGAGAVAGGVLPAPAQRGWAARWSAGLEVLSQARSLGRESRPYAVTANLLVRREAFDRLGGFAEGVRSGGDTEFSWRLQDDGWSIDHRPRAAVLHQHRTTMPDLVKQYRRYGAGAAWLDRRYPGALSGWPTISRAMLSEPLRDLAAGRFELAVSRATELITTAGAWVGALSSNRAERPGADRPAATVAFAGAFPDADAPEPCGDVARLAPEVAVEARRRPRRFARPRPDVPVSYAEDDAPLDRLAALRWLARQPDGRAGLAAAAAQGAAGLRALGADAAVARRVADRLAVHLVAVDADPGATTAMERVTALAGPPSAPAGTPANVGDAER